jgi:hypothetical protein
MNDLSQLSDDELRRLSGQQQASPLASMSDDQLRAAYAKATVEPTTFGQTAAMGAGRTLDRLAAGARQMAPAPIRNALDWVNDKLGMGANPSIDPAEQAKNTAIYEGASKQHPVAAFTGEVAPLMFTGNPLAMAARWRGVRHTRRARDTRAQPAAGARSSETIGSGVSRPFTESASIAPKLMDEFFPLPATSGAFRCPLGNARSRSRRRFSRVLLPISLVEPVSQPKRRTARSVRSTRLSARRLARIRRH